MQQADQFVATFAVGFFALLGAELLILHRMIVLVEPHHHRALILRVVWHKQIAAIANKNTRRIKEPIGLEAPLDSPIEPSLPIGGRNIPDEFAQEVLITGRHPRVVVLFIKAAAFQQDLLRLGSQVFGGNLGRQSREQAAATHDSLESVERIFQVQLQTEISRQDKPPRHLFFLALRGHRLGQGVQNLLPEAQLEKLLLVGLTNDFELIKLTTAKGFQDPLRVVFDELQISRGRPPCFAARLTVAVGLFGLPGSAGADDVWPAPPVRADSAGTRRPIFGLQHVVL